MLFRLSELESLESSSGSLFVGSCSRTPQRMSSGLGVVSVLWQKPAWPEGRCQGGREQSANGAGWMKVAEPGCSISTPMKRALTLKTHVNPFGSLAE